MTFKITQNPAALPSSCIFCPGSARPWYVDCEYSIEFHGALYICSECIREMANICGYLSKEESVFIGEKLDLKDLEVIKLRAAVANLEKAIDSLVDAGYRQSGADTTKYRLNMDDEVAKPQLQKSDDILGVGKGETSQQSDDEGLGELFPDVSAESEFEFDI